MILNLTDKEYITFITPAPAEQMVLYDRVKLKLHTPSVELMISYQYAEAVLRNVHRVFSAVLRNQLPLDPTLNRDIGYMSNHYYHQSVARKKNNSWVGKRFLLWSCGIQPYLNTWVYNDSEGNIVMHITESYFWHFLDKSKGQNYISYNKFIRNYKPTLTRTIPHQVARQWLAQCDYLLGMVTENAIRAADETCKDCV